jgi:hypothetical protein
MAGDLAARSLDGCHADQVGECSLARQSNALAAPARMSCAIVAISSRISALSRGRPIGPRECQRQKSARPGDASG